MTGAGTDKTRPAIEGGPAVILVRPQLAVNIGMCARAMANFGLSDLRLVNPRDGWPRTGALRKGAFAAAAGAVHLLEGAKLYDTLEAAIADLNYVWATTARERGQGKRVEGPSAAWTNRPVDSQGRQGGHPFRARAHGHGQRRDRDRGLDHHVSGQSGLRLAQSRPGRASLRV